MEEEEFVFVRRKYITHLEKWSEKPVIKVVTGIRRTGKSFLFKMFIEHLKANGVGENQIVYLNLEDMANSALLEAAALHDYISARLVPDKFTYVFIDEIQNCRGFEKAINSLHLRPLVDIYVTGSNAYFLSSELATLLSGRYVTIEVLPLSFSEYVQFKKIDSGRFSTDEKKRHFNTYMTRGQFPYLPFINEDAQLVKDYLDGILNTIIIKDVVTRERITEVLLLQKIIKCMCDAVGSPLSVKKITDTLISGGRKVSVNTVEQYVRALCDSFIFYQVPRFDIRGRQVLKTLEKYYLADTGLRTVITAAKTGDFGHLLENIVYLELRRRFSKVMVGKSDRDEIDFVAQNKQEFVYVQVCQTVLDESVLERELKPLARIKDSYPKLLLTLDDFIPESSYNGIVHKNIIEWLLEEW